ncbi:hypothetical protein BGY98DRAFT_365091 [Russula aff. rugulosa BPL654]|nr:hypothetical protein BGY98DRAFT_365091 [Russula aff. rugulosa BPL654]
MTPAHPSFTKPQSVWCVVEIVGVKSTPQGMQSLASLDPTKKKHHPWHLFPQPNHDHQLVFPLPLNLTVFHSHISPHHTMNRSDLTDADIAAALWRLLEGMAGSSDTSGPQGVHENSITGDPATADTDLTNFNAGNDTALRLPSPIDRTFTGQLNYSHPGHADAWAMPAQGRPFSLLQRPFGFTGSEGFSDAGSVAPNLVGNLHMTGVSLYAADSAAATPNPVTSPSSSATPPGSQDEVAWHFGPGKSIYHPTFSAFGVGRKGHGCASGIRREYLWFHEVSILSILPPIQRSDSASVANLMLVDIHRGGLPTKWSGPFPPHPHQRHPHPPDPGETPPP